MIFAQHITALTGDVDGDGFVGDADPCPEVYDVTTGCPEVATFQGIDFAQRTGDVFTYLENNQCLWHRAGRRSIIEAVPVCDTTTCRTTISLHLSLRHCDIIFPAIMVPDFTSIISRGQPLQID